MTSITRMGAFLLIAMALGLGTIPAVQAQEGADLELAKVLFQTGEPVFAGDQVSWNLTLTNNGPEGATGIEVAEHTDLIGDFTLDSFEAGEGTAFDGSTWTIPALAAGESTTLNLTMTVNGHGDVTNSASIEAADQEDPDPANNQASDSATVGASITAEIDVKPETLNLGSRGVFTVFITFDGDYTLDTVNLEASSLFCNGAEAQKLHVSQKDGGTLMAKFRRQDLVVVEPDTAPADDGAGGGASGGGDVGDGSMDGGKTLTITCEGTIQFGEEAVRVSGSDTVRVTGEKKKGLAAFLAGILDRVLPVDDGTDDGGAGDTTSTTPVREQDRNRHQQEKGSQNGNLNRARDRTECSGECSDCTADCGPSGTPGTQGNGDTNRIRDRTECTGDECPGCTGDCGAAQTPGTHGNGKKTGSSGDDTVTGSQGNGNQGNGNGQGNSNRPDKDKSNGKK